MKGGSYSVIKPKELRQLYKEVERQGADVSFTKSNHIRIEYNGHTGFHPCTASDKRSYLNTRAHLRKMGLDL